jgi:hypothetical protein
MYTKRAFKATAFDHLESREVMSGMTFAGPHAHAAIVQPHPLLGAPPAGNTMKNVSQDLNMVYNAFAGNTATAEQLASQYPMLYFQGNSVSVMVKGKGDFNTLLRDLRSAGMTITTSSSFYNIVIGYLPITALPTAAKLPETGNISPNYRIALGHVSPGHALSHPISLGGGMMSLGLGSFHVG